MFRRTKKPSNTEAADAVVQRVVVEKHPEKPTWNVALSEAVSQSFATTQEALRSGGATIVDLEMSVSNSILSAESTGVAISAYRRAKMIDKLKLDKTFRLPVAHVNPVHDTMQESSDAAQNVKGMSFNLLTEEELYNTHGHCISQLRVYSPYEWDERLGHGGAPNAHGLLDERMGPVRNRTADGSVVHCPVCSGYMNMDPFVSEKRGEPNLCPGHFGHIMLPAALWHPMTEKLTQCMLRSFCWHCGSLPGDDEKNRDVVGVMFQTCETRVDKLKFLSHKYAATKTCAQCSKARRCSECHQNGFQCQECKSFQYFRPKLRTMIQADKAKEKLRKHMMESADLGDDADDMRRAARANNFTGFPCDALLAGHVEENQAEYARFAEEQYGNHADNGVLVMHGERVRAVIEQMSDDYLQLFCVTSFDTIEDVRGWFRSMVPRVIPVIPNPARPTDVGHAGSASVRLDDLTKRYKELLRRCAAFSKRLDHYHPNDDPTTLYGQQSDIYASKKESWFEWSTLDFNYMELYGELQYYYVAILSDTRALQFRPSLAAAHGIGNSVVIRNRKAATGDTGGDGNSGKQATLVSSIEKRLKGKEGRLRENLQGKRVANGARTVITCAPIYSIRDVRVPAKIASLLQVKERINGLNVNELVARAERARTNNVERELNHEACGGRGCAYCERLWVDEKTELCMFSAEGDERIKITGSQGLKTPVSEHPLVREIGTVIERSLQTGDLVLMNRQPSLHKNSTMVHRVIVDEHTKTLGLHELATDPYNADFDGDEMHLFVTGDLQALAESRTIMAVSAQMVSCQNSSSIFALKQNAATGMYMLTSPDTFLPREDAISLIMQADHPIFPSPDAVMCLPQPAVRYKRAGRWHMLWTGLQLANLTLPQLAPSLNFKHPADFDFDARTLNYPEKGVQNNTVLPILIENSTFLMGRINSSCARAITNAIISRTTLSNERAREEACDFIDRCSWLASAYLTIHGFSIGIGDCVVPDSVSKKVCEVVGKVETEVDKMLREDDELMITGAHMNRVSAIEERIMEIERKGFNGAWSIIMKAMTSQNALLVMQVSGGKGKPENGAQIMGCVGGQQVEGRRVIDTYAGFKTLRGDAAPAAGAGNNDLSEVTSGGSGMKKGKPTRLLLDEPIASRRLDHLSVRQNPHAPRMQYPRALDGGFIANSYMTGLTPREFWFHAQAGREGGIDTAVKTSDSGDAQRLAMKSSEDVVVRADRTVRNASNQLVSFRYAGVGYDPTFVQKKSLGFIGMNDDALARALFYKANDPSILHCDAIALWREENALRKSLAELRALSCVRGSETHIFTPHNLQAIIVEVLAELGQDRQGAQWRSLDDKRVQWSVHCDNEAALAVLGLNSLQEDQCFRLVEERCRVWRERGICDYITECEVRMRLSSKQAVRRLGLSTEALQRILDLYEETLYRSIAVSGESVGAQMVQSIGQPATQMTLNSVDYATPLAIVWRSTERAPPAPVDGPVGALIDALMVERAGQVQMQPDGVTAYLPLAVGEAIALSTDEKGLLKWTALEAVTRHPVVNQDGSSTLMRVTLRSGRRVDITRSKSILIVRGCCVVAIDGDELRIGDNVPVALYTPSDMDTEIDLHLFMRLSEIGDMQVLGDHALDPVISIEPIDPTRPLVYDLTVAETRNMCTMSGVALADTFQMTGKRNMGVLGGIPRMKELSNAKLSNKIKTIRVALPLSRGLLVTTGQRRLAAQLAAKLVTPEALQIFSSRFVASKSIYARIFHEKSIADEMMTPMRRVALERFVANRRAVEKSLSCASAGRRDGTNYQSSIDAMLDDIAHFLPSKETVVDDDATIGSVRTLESMSCNWRVESVAAVSKKSGWSAESLKLLTRAKTVLIAEVPEQYRHDTTAELFCESVWRATLAVFGTDVPCAVVPRTVVCNESGPGIKRRRRSDAPVVVEFVIAALDCERQTYEEKMYEYIRLNRQSIFIDLLTDVDSTTLLWRAALYAREHVEPSLFIADVDGASAGDDRDAELLRRKVADINVAQVRRHFKNVVSTRLIDITDTYFVAYEPLSIDEETRQVTVHMPETGAAAPSDSDRVHCESHYMDNCFDDLEVGCREPECLTARRDGSSGSAQTGCLSSWVLVFRLSNKWFERNAVSPHVIVKALQQELGAFYYITVGDENCEPYVPLRVRVYTCRIENALAMTHKTNLLKLDTFVQGQIDDTYLVLDRVKWLALHHAFLGPEYGSAVMCEEERVQIFTDERGLEHRQRPIIVSNSPDLYHLLALRGIDASAVRTNAVHDALDIFGVEAARVTLMNEYSTVLQGAYVNRSHYALRADIQTRDGGYLSLTAAGLRSAPHDVCQSASHRETAMMFVQAALHQRVIAPLVSPSASVMVGQQLSYNGTGAVTLLADMDALMTMASNEQPEPAAVLAANDRQHDTEMLERYRALEALNESMQEIERKRIYEEDQVDMAFAGSFSPVRVDSSDWFDSDKLPEPVVAEPSSDDIESVWSPHDGDAEFLASMREFDETYSPSYEETLPAEKGMAQRVTAAKVTGILQALGGQSIAYSPTAVASYSPTSPAYDEFDSMYASSGSKGGRVNMKMF